MNESAFDNPLEITYCYNKNKLLDIHNKKQTITRTSKEKNKERNFLFHGLILLSIRTKPIIFLLKIPFIDLRKYLQKMIPLEIKR